MVDGGSMCAAFTLKWCPLVLAICHGVIQRDNKKIAAKQIASGLQALLTTPVVILDIHLINAYHVYFLCKHFAWLQKGDPAIGNKPGFSNNHIGVQYHMMLEDLTNAWENEGWKQLGSFKGFRQSMVQFDNKTKLEQVMKANHFLEFARNALITHFQIWVNDLLFFLLYSEPKAAHVVAKSTSTNGTRRCQKYLHDGPIVPTQDKAIQEYKSNIHERAINLTKGLPHS
jgi:hypothetical protein